MRDSIFVEIGVVSDSDSVLAIGKVGYSRRRREGARVVCRDIEAPTLQDNINAFQLDE